MFENVHNLVDHREIPHHDIPDYIYNNMDENRIMYLQERVSRCSIYEFTYKSDGLKVKGYWVQPKDIPAGKKLPVIIWNRGGNAGFGMIDYSHIVSSFALLAAAGYIVIGSQYRGSAGSEGQDGFGGGDVNDIINLKPLIDTFPAADNQRIGMLGRSRGGMMTYMALMKIDRVKCAVIKSATTNLVEWANARPEVQEMLTKCFGGGDQEKKKRSVVHQADKLSKECPLFLAHGSADWKVSVKYTLDMAQALYDNNIPYRLVIYEGADHSLSEFMPQYTTMILEWFQRYLMDDVKVDMTPHGR